MAHLLRLTCFGSFAAAYLLGLLAVAHLLWCGSNVFCIIKKLDMEIHAWKSTTLKKIALVIKISLREGIFVDDKGVNCTSLEIVGDKN